MNEWILCLTCSISPVLGKRNVLQTFYLLGKKPELKLPLKPYMKCEKNCLAKFYLNEENGNSYMQTLYGIKKFPCKQAVD